MSAGITVIGWILHPALLTLGMVATLFSLYFFRDPERPITAGPGQIVAPADGKVLSVDEAEEPEYMGGRCKRVGIFLSIFDVHINRAPLAGTIEMIHYRKGKFGVASTEGASLHNERNTIGIGGGDIRVAVKQIAGAVARRIICYCKLEQKVETGDRIGMIKFGSRTELYLPLDCEILVSPGQKVKGGISLIGACNASTEKKA